ncbi:MAG: HRDC domain-containing protein [Bacteroidaceae bacterium]|nr:HRDC domain-containing protein [Bacteroidaceae bacterium]
MQIKTFKIPLGDNGGAEEELNKFLRSHRVLKVERAFCLEGSGYLAVCVEYMEGNMVSDNVNTSGRSRRDYAKELSEDEQKRFELFKAKRRELATEKSLPAYMIFTDAELVTLLKYPHLNIENVMDVPGVQKSRLKDYGAYFVNLQEASDEANRQPDAADTPF